jgi:hypothetical protein
MEKSDMDGLISGIRVGEWPWGLYLLDVLKNDFVEFDEEMFQWVERPCQPILYILSIEIIDLDKVA